MKKISKLGLILGVTYFVVLLLVRLIPYDCGGSFGPRICFPPYAVVVYFPGLFILLFLREFLPFWTVFVFNFIFYYFIGYFIEYFKAKLKS
jgi:hypothetical protein